MLPAVDPTPIPVLIVNDPPGWWIEVGLPTFTAVSSTTVALVAVGLTWYLANRERKRQKQEKEESDRRKAHEARATVGGAAFDYLEATRHNFRDFTAFQSLARVFAATGVEQEPLLRWLAETSKTQREAYQAAQSWSDEHVPPDPRDYDSEWEHEQAAAPLQAYEVAYYAVVAEIHQRLRDWMLTGDIDSTPVKSFGDHFEDG